jgi:ABC-type sugar transport system ATPase subunit
MISVSGITVLRDRRRVLDRVELAVAPEETVAILGPSGSGKSTLLRAILGLVPIAEGSLRIGAHATERTPPEERSLAMVFQDLALWPHLTVHQNLAFGLEVKRVARAERERRIAATLESLGLAALADRRPGRLSGGEQQRVALARALVLDPIAMLFDEPFASLDVMLKAELVELVRRLLRERALTALFVTHDPWEARALADRVVVLEEGRITASGTIEEVSASASTPFLRALGSSR